MLRVGRGTAAAVIATLLTFGAVGAAASTRSLDSAATVRAPADRMTRTPVDAPPPPPAATAPATTGSTAGQRVVDLLNAERASRGLPAVAWHDQVAAAASLHSDDQAAHRQMSHTGSDGSNTGDRLDRVGFDWRGWAENVGAGYPTPAAMFEGWLNSDGHRANMLGNYRYVGVAVTSADGVRYWTMVLAN